MFTTLAIESPPSQNLVLGFLNGALNSLKRDISRMFAVLYGRPNIDEVARSNEDEDSLHPALKSLMTTVGDHCDLRSSDCFSEKRNFDGEGDPPAVFNVLDALLKGSLDRLKAMRESICLAKSGLQKCFLEAVPQPDYTVMVRDLCLKGKLGAALLLRRKLMREGGDMIQAVALWDEMVEKKTEIDVVAYNVLIHGLCLNQDKKIALGYVVDMLKRGFLPDIFTYNTLISDLCKEGQFGEAYYIHDVMSRMGVSPDQISYKMIIQGLCMTGDAIKANEFLNLMLEKSMVPEAHIWNLIIDCYGRYGYLRDAISIRDQMLAAGVLPNVYTYNALIHAQVKGGNIFSAYSLKKDMLLLGLFPDVVTYNLLIHGACKCGQIRFALQLYDEMLRKGYEPDKITYTELIRGHCMCGDMKEAEDLFIELHRSGLPMDIVPFKVIFEKYHRIGEPDMALKFYQRWFTMMAWGARTE